MDLISRQAAIDAMEQAKEQYFDRRVIIGKMQDIVNNLPSAEPRRGEWIPRPGDYICIYTCSECGAVGHRTAFCPHCGARMEESDGGLV